MQRRQQIDVLTVISLLVMGLAWRVFILHQQPFDGLYGQDAYAYFDFAQQLRAFASTGQLPEPFFWPWGYPVLLAVGQIIGLSGQAINIILGALLPVLSFLLARQIGLRWLGAITAGILMLACGQAMQSSLVVMADVPALFWLMLSATALLRFHYRRAGGWLVMAAIFLALASVTRWLYLLLALPWAISVLTNGRIPWRAVVVTAVVSSLVIVGQVALNAASGYPTLNYYGVQQWSILNATKTEFTNPDGHFVYATTNAAFYAQPFYDPYYLTPVITPFVVIGLIALLATRRVLLVGLIGGWALLPYIFLIGIPYHNIRFPLIVFPAVALLAGIGFDTMQQRIRWRVPVWIALCAILLVGSGFTLQTGRQMIGDFIARQQRDKDAAAWVARQMPPDATIYTFGLTLILDHDYPALDVRELYYETPESLAAKWQRDRADYLVVNTYQVENQWADTNLQAAYHWLRNERGYITIGKRNGFTLFYIKR